MRTLLLLVVVACGGEEERAAPKTQAPAVTAAVGPRMDLCTPGEEGCAVGPRAPVESYTIPMTPTPAQPPRFRDVSPRMAAPAPELPAGCAAVLGSPPRAALNGEAVFEKVAGKQPDPPAVSVKITPGQKVAVAPDGWAVAIGSSGQVSIRDGHDGHELVLLGVREQSITGLAFLPDGKRLVVAGSDLRLYDVTTGRQLAEAQMVAADALAVAPTGGRIATISADGQATLYGPSLARSDTAWLFRFPRRLAFSPDGTQLAAYHLDEAVSLWQLEPPEVVSGVLGHAGAAKKVESSGAGLVSLGAGRVCRWPDEAGGRPTCLEGYERAALAPGGRAVAVAIGAGVWMYRGDEVVEAARVDERFGVTDVAFTRDGRFLLVLWGRSLEVHDAADGHLVRTVPLPDQSLADLHAASGSHALFSRSSDGHLFIADLSGATPAVGPLDFGGFWSSAWSPDGRTAIAADWTLRRIDRAGALVAELRLDGQVQAGAWSPDGRWFAAGSDHAVAAFGAAGNRTRWTSSAAVAPIAAIDRSLLAARDREEPGTILLLDARTGAERGRLVGGELAGTVEHLFPLPGRRLAAASWEGRILLWRVP